MPYVDVTYPTGSFSFAYAIATPTSYSADEIVPDLPCIIFLHSGYVGKEVFELQFSDRRLRQFNLIAIDMRGYGDTQGWIGDMPCTPAESARDVEQVMAKLKLPPSHVFGLSNGCNVALELAVARPDLVLSLTLCSPLSPEEPEEIAEGRLMVFNYWKDLNDETEKGAQPNDELAAEIAAGAAQLLYNNARTNRIESIHGFTLDKSQEIWLSSPQKVEQSYKACIEWFLKRRPIPPELYKKIQVPISIIHCSEDFAYPVQFAEELKESLESAGVPKVSLHRVPGSHYGNVTNPRQINGILYQTVTSCHPEMSFSQLSLNSTREPKSGRLPTPFTDTLKRYGYDADSEESEEDEEEEEEEAD